MFIINNVIMVVPIWLEESFRLTMMVTSWVYFKYSNHGLFIVNIVLSVIASGIGLALIIYQCVKYYPDAKARALRKVDYMIIY